jgi:hypothetical protein
VRRSVTPDQERAGVWKILRISVLLLVLVVVAAGAWLDRKGSTSWKEPLWVGIYPISADGSPAADRYIATLTEATFADIETFFEREGPRFKPDLSHPIHMVLYPRSSELPPGLSPAPSRLSVILWSLKLRWFASHASAVPGRAPPRVRLFVLYHDPQSLSAVPDSHGMQKGLIGVIHAFADKSMARTNNVVIAHELLHTLGATDKYVDGTGQPRDPDGLADPDQKPLYPQARAEIMAGRRALSETDAEIPDSLRDVVVGPQTAQEIHWTRP